MNLYKIVIKPVNSFCSPLQSDTFFGAFCWSYLYQYGERALQELIDHYKNGEPDIIFSNAFPSGRLPMPFGTDETDENQNTLLTKHERYASYIYNKKKSCLSTITLNEFNMIINGGKAVFSDDYNTHESTVESWRNMVGRDSNMVESAEGQGSLFEVEETYSSENYDIYIYSKFTVDVLDSTLREMFRTGIGAQRSVGKGAFEIVEKMAKFEEFAIPEQANAFVALSNFVPRKDDPTEGFYKTFVKYPKVSYISSEEDSPFKKPLIFLLAGSTFYTHFAKDFYGSCVEKVTLKAGRVSDRIVIGAYTIAVPCFIKI
jgi:hypothetical protein